MLNIDNQSKYRVINSLFERIQKIVFTEEKADLDRYIDLLFVDNYESRSYNKRFRGKDSETDVISFPAELEFLPTYGDIIIDISVADRQKDNRTLEEELTTLFLHGVLHLLGYDHLSKKGKEIMELKENKYIKLITKKEN